MTNGSKGWQDDKLEAIGLDGIIPKEYVFISEVIGYEKPSPEIYHYVLSMTSLPPEQVLVVGDSWTNDVAAPIQEGLKAIWLNKKNYQVPQEPRPLAVITEIEELRAILLSHVGDHYE
ncbi:HAD family hydrolase [Cohnella phaseoli]|uniref:HAD family hydrolase n=1 Tax=Cohnella phaseoli TaxID=456490 RepID=UPI000E267E4C|nr:HAD family hydrolase [Cohnella phaseoli]